MNMIKIRLSSYICIGESNLIHLMLIAIESPDEVSDSELNCIVANVWNEKPRTVVWNRSLIALVF